MRHVSWFVLPAGQEFYYRRHSASYRPLPALRADCLADAAAEDKQQTIEFLYPNVGTRLYIPVDLGQKGPRDIRAVHRDSKATLYWHLDERYLGATTVFHQQALDISPGPHVITVIDQQGNRLARQFEVLEKQAGREDQIAARD